MVKAFKYLLFFVLCLKSLYGQGQDAETEKPRNWALDGYLSNMESIMFQDLDSLWIMDNLIHNRLNFNWYLGKTLTFNFQARNRILLGDQVRNDLSGQYAEGVAHDRGFLDMTENLIKERSVLLNVAADRLWLMYEKGNLNIKLGRQRINWGQTFAWNPNDLFNNYSFFDFDYPEKPGSDALRIQYYTGTTSVIDLAVKADESKEVTVAGLFRFNKWKYDIQFIAGMLAEQDYVIGAGWSGNIKTASFRGETSYFHPKDHFADTSGLFYLSLSTDYTFRNSMMLMFEFFYGQKPDNSETTNFMAYYAAPMSVKNLAFTEYNLFGQLSYPLNPLTSGTVSAMYFPELNGFFAGPSLSYSLKENVDLSVFAQIFSGEFPDPLTGKDSRQNFFLGFFRLKWSY